MWLNSDTSKSSRGGSKGSRRKAATVLFGIVAMVGVAVLGMKMLEGRVLAPGDRESMASRVVLADAPIWMPAELIERIVRAVTPENLDFRNSRLKAEVYEKARRNPWISNVVRVEKHRASGGDVVELYASYRRPLAKAYWRHLVFYIDMDGYILPTGDVPAYYVTVRSDTDGRMRQISYLAGGEIKPPSGARKINFLEIRGLAGRPPAVGRQWIVAGLRDTLRLASLMFTRPKYAREIVLIDVTDTDDDAGPKLVMSAQARSRGPVTKIIFGRFPKGNGDFVVYPERKLSYLDEYYGKFGRLGGHHSELDLRHDELRAR